MSTLQPERNISFLNSARLTASDFFNIGRAIVQRDPMGRYYRQLRTFPEGFVMPEQAARLRQIANSRHIFTIAEIGFNGGHSAYNFLLTSPFVRVVSFESSIGSHVMLAKKRIDSLFPQRHKLITGDSKEKVPLAAADGLRAGLIFIDGDHSLEGARADLENCRGLADQDTIVVMDDIDPVYPWGVGPSEAWREAERAGKLETTSQHFLREHRSMAVGRYLGLPTPAEI